MWPCIFTSPGMMVLPATSKTLAFLGTETCSAGPTAVMRLPVTTTVPCSITCSPCIVMRRPLVNASVPTGTSPGTSRSTEAYDLGSCAPEAKCWATGTRYNDGPNAQCTVLESAHQVSP